MLADVRGTVILCRDSLDDPGCEAMLLQGLHPKETVPFQSEVLPWGSSS